MRSSGSVGVCRLTCYAMDRFFPFFFSLLASLLCAGCNHDEMTVRNSFGLIAPCFLPLLLPSSRITSLTCICTFSAAPCAAVAHGRLSLSRQGSPVRHDIRAEFSGIQSSLPLQFLSSLACVSGGTTSSIVDMRSDMFHHAQVCLQHHELTVSIDYPPRAA